MSDGRTPSSQPAGNDEASSGKPVISGPEWTRRSFLYGSAAAAAGAVMFGGIERSPARIAGRGFPGRHPGQAGPDQSSGWSLTQNGARVSEPGSVTLTLTNPSSPGSLVVATLLSTNGDQPFSAPASSVWQFAGAAALPPETGQTTSLGRVEIWYYLNPPGGTTQISSATFTSSGGDCRGCMSEFAPPAGTTVVLDTRGQGAQTENGALQAAFGISAVSGNAVGDLGIVVAGDFFSGNTSGTWSGPNGYTFLRLLNGVADNFGAWYDLDLSTAGPQSPSVTYQYTGTPTQIGWAVAFAAFRAITFQPLYLAGGELATMAAIDPASQQLILGGDVEGLWRSCDLGGNWQLSQYGLYQDGWRYTACVAWSRLETTAPTVYACVGHKPTASSPNGGLLVSTDGGLTWGLRSNGVQFQGNDVAIRPAGEPGNADRSSGHLLAQDPQGGYLYTATYNGGIARSSASYGPPVGTSWQIAGLNQNPAGSTLPNPFYPRALVLNPSNNEELWAGLWQYTDGSVTPNVTYGGIYHCTTAQTASSNSNWMQVTPPAGVPATATVADLKVIGGYLYAVYTSYGTYVCQLSTGAWTNLNVGVISVTNGQIWTTVDGYVDSSGNHQIFAGSSSGNNPGASGTLYTNVVQISVTFSGSGTPSGTSKDLTGAVGSSVTVNMLPPYGQEYWHYQTMPQYPDWLGGAQFVNPHILVDSNDPKKIYVAGASGFYRTTDGGNSWTIADNGVVMSVAAMIAVDPQNPEHIILASADHIHTDMTDPTGWDTAGNAVKAVKMPNPFSSDPAYRGNESHAVAFDPGSNVYTGMNEKFGANAGGTVYWRQAGQFTWYDTGYNVAVVKKLGVTSEDVPAPIGIYAGVNGTTTFLVVVSDGSDVWYTTTPASTLQGSNPNPVWASNWTQLNTAIGTQNNPGMHCPIVPDPENAGVFYAYDRGQGVFRATGYGSQNSQWTKIWSIPSGESVADSKSGWLAANPAPPTGVTAELWVTTSNNIWKLDNTGNANTGPFSPASMSGSSFPYGAAGVAINSAGTVYSLAISGANQPAVALYAYPAGGTGWQTADPSGAIASYVSWPTSITISQNPYSSPANAQMLIIASDSDWAVYGTPSV